MARCRNRSTKTTMPGSLHVASQSTSRSTRSLTEVLARLEAKKLTASVCVAHAGAAGSAQTAGKESGWRSQMWVRWPVQGRGRTKHPGNTKMPGRPTNFAFFLCFNSFVPSSSASCFPVPSTTCLCL